MPRVFISYRRGDSAGYTGRIHDRLVSVLGDKCVFLDVADIEPGDDYLANLEREIGAANYVLVVIGREWLEATEGARRIDDPRDPVQWEIRTAFDKGRTLIPILVDSARMPSEQDLPKEIRSFARCEAIEISHALFEQCMERLFDAIGVKESKSTGRPWLYLLLAALALTFFTRMAFSLSGATQDAPLDAADSLFVFLFWLSLAAGTRWLAMWLARRRSP